jgi:hypothetical protein
MLKFLDEDFCETEAQGKRRVNQTLRIKYKA